MGVLASTNRDKKPENHQKLANFKERIVLFGRQINRYRVRIGASIIDYSSGRASDAVARRDFKVAQR